MEHMHDEMVRAMQLCGANSLAALTPDLVRRQGRYETRCAECCSHALAANARAEKP